MKSQIQSFANSIGIQKCAVAEYNGKSAIVCLFPYYSGYRKGNLSIYTYCEDYHSIVNKKLSQISDFIKSISPQSTCECFCDIGPNIDRHLAYKAGLGFYGKNQMLINDDYGTYFFIGYVLTDLVLEYDSPLNKECLNCGKCIQNCPGKALDNGFNIELCASHISQKKGTLSDEEIEVLRKSGLIFGCDMCQSVCPHNKISPCAMEEFTHNLIFNLKLSDIENYSNKEFNAKYKNRAFSWRGKNVLLRNINLLKSAERER